jgi:endonuclease/exonuclease/phosphatase family metal-dependent hydrolase
MSHYHISGNSCFTVLNLNLRFGLADDGPNRWENRRKAFAPLLSAYPSDFYSFQEVNDFQAEFLDALLADYTYIGLRCPAPAFWQNNVIFYHRRWQCRSHGHFYLSPTPDIPSRFRSSRWPRQCTWGCFQCNGRSLVCVTTHFDFLSDIQKKSAELILNRLHSCIPSGPTVLMGDFNATPDSACYKVFTAPEQESVGGFQSAFKPPYCGTHHGFSGKCDTRAPIDWILFRGALHVMSAHVVTHRFAGLFPSDHFALSAEFSFSE